MAFDIASLIGGSIGDAFQKIVSAFKVPPEQALAAQTQLAQIQAELQGKIIDQVTSQIDVDKTEASNVNMFVAGWRPGIGWICGVGLGIQFVVNPLATWIAALCKHPIVFPSLDLGTLMTLLFGMLGLGGMRTYEKVQGLPDSHPLK